MAGRPRINPERAMSATERAAALEARRKQDGVRRIVAYLDADTAARLDTLRHKEGASISDAVAVAINRCVGERPTPVK